MIGDCEGGDVRDEIKVHGEPQRAQLQVAPFRLLVRAHGLGALELDAEGGYSFLQ